MINDITLTMTAFGFGFCVLIPLTLIIYLLAKRKIRFFPVFIGLSCFIIFQMMLRGTLANILSFAALEKNIFLGAVLSGLMIALFNEIGRFVFYKTALQEHRTWADGFAFGLGYGTMEAIFITGISSISNFAYMVMINSGSFEDFSKTVDPAVAQQIYNTITQTSGVTYLLEGMERACLIVIQIAISLMMLWAIKTGKNKLIFMAVIFCIAVDVPYAVFSAYDMWLGMPYVLLWAAGGVWYILEAKKRFEKLEPRKTQFAPRLKRKI